MELEQARELIRKCVEGHSAFIHEAEQAERYYIKKNDILKTERKQKEEDDPLHQADNKIPSNYFKLLINQKTAYAFTVPPKFDVGEDGVNEKIRETLGDAWKKKCKTLCKEASKKKVAWLHYWKGKNGEFKYASVKPEQVVPVWTPDLEKELLAVLRYYHNIDEATGKTYEVYEIWTDKECQTFRRRVDLEWETMEEYSNFLILDIDTNTTENTNIYKHDFQEVPFIFFNNNDEMQSDLEDIKELIDAYDKVYSGFINDMEDIQEIIFVLTNYGGEKESAKEVLQQMKNKIILVDNDGPEDKSGVSTLSIEIPVEARKEILKITRNAIFEQGMGIDPDPQNFGDSSGVALKYLYSLLELKTGMMETEFEPSFNRLIRAICRFYGYTPKKITQIWKRTSVTNNVELAQICNQSKGIISDETIVRNHPLVTDPDKEIKLLKEQNEREIEEISHEWDKIPVIPEDGDGKE